MSAKNQKLEIGTSVRNIKIGKSVKYITLQIRESKSTKDQVQLQS